MGRGRRWFHWADDAGTHSMVAPATLAARGYQVVRRHPFHPGSTLMVKPKPPAAEATGGQGRPSPAVGPAQSQRLQRTTGPLIPASSPELDQLPGPVIVTIRYSRPLTTLTRAERARLVTLLSAYVADVEKGGAMGDRVVKFALAGP